MVGIKLYVEGGGDGHDLRTRCREGFRSFLEKAGFGGRMPRIVACGGRKNTYDRFKTACQSGDTAFLLIDSEDSIATKSPWSFLANRPGDGFTMPPNATDDHCHLMVVCMEAWFLADRNALSRFFGHGFNDSALPQSASIESIRKSDIFVGLRNATQDCVTKSTYSKGEHSFRILLELDPDEVRKASPWAQRFLKTLDDWVDS